MTREKKMRKASVISALALAIIPVAFSAVSAGAAQQNLFTGSAGSIQVTAAVPTSIPVFDWHELNNGCLSTAPVCNAPDPESVSTAQLTAELSYLKAHSYHTISAAQYLAWAEGSRPTLPANPVLLIADNGINNFLSGAQKILEADG